MARDSDGAYDLTVGPLVNLWSFDPDRRPRRLPAVVAIAAAKARVGWWKVKLDPAAHRAWQPGGLAVDLAAVAKGYGVDQVGRYLRRMGVTSWLVEVGGELKAHGRKPDGLPWHVGIEQPDAAAGDRHGRTGADDPAGRPCDRHLRRLSPRVRESREVLFAFSRLAMRLPAALAGLRYGLLALCDSDYEDFCRFGRQLQRWRVDAGAAIYVCGSLDGLAAGVEAVLHDVPGARQVDQLREQGRYRRDVY